MIELGNCLYIVIKFDYVILYNFIMGNVFIFCSLGKKFLNIVGKSFEVESNRERNYLYLDGGFVY